MVKLDSIQKRLIEEIADLHSVPTGAYNFRANSQLAGRNTTANIDIVSKPDGSGIDIHIKPGTRNESCPRAASKKRSITTSMSAPTATSSSSPAAASTTAAARIPSTTAFTASFSKRAPKSAMWKSITAPVTAAADAS